MGKHELLDHQLTDSQVESHNKAKLPGLAKELHSRYRCEVCEQTWRDPPTSKCPGAKIYSWDPWPQGLFTRKQLAAKKLLPGALAGVIRYDKSADGDGWLRLYRETDAAPKPALSAKRQAALEKMHAAAEAARHCGQCGSYLSSRAELASRLCEPCGHKLMAEADRLEAGRTAYDLICQGDFVVWDSETTDLTGRFVEIAVIDAYGKVLLDQRLRPRCLITPGAYEVHGIKDEDLACEPTFFDIYHELRQVLHGRHWIVYNGAFDMGILDNELSDVEYAHYYERYPIQPCQTTCAMHLYAAWYGEWHGYYKNYRWQMLGSAAARFNIQVHQQAHSALGDCLRTLEVLYAMADWYRRKEL